MKVLKANNTMLQMLGYRKTVGIKNRNKIEIKWSEATN